MTKKLTKKQETIISQLLRMHEMFPGNETELVYYTPFQLLIAVMMSAQTTDKQVNVVTQTLRNFVTCPQDVVALWHDRLHDMIRSVNYHNAKAKHIYETSQILCNQRSTDDELWYQIPQEISQLITLPWVWVKTAKVVLHVLFWQNRIAADTHVHRVANRLAWVKQQRIPEEGGRPLSPEKTSEQLEKLIPDEYKSIAHHSIILRWRYHCKAIKPHCDTCPLKSQCNWYTKNHKLPT